MPLNVRSQLVLCAVLLAPALAHAGASSAPPPPAAGAEEANDPTGRSLEERVSDLKEKIFRTKTRLTNLQEMATGGDVATGSRAVLVHRNEMGSSFRLESVSYALDGAPIYTKADAGGDLEKPELEIFDGRIAPGSHQLAVQLTYRGSGHGVFTYVEGYKFKVESSFTFSAEPGKVSTIKVVGFEKGGLTAELKDRPAIRFDVDAHGEDAASAKAPAAEGSGK